MGEAEQHLSTVCKRFAKIVGDEELDQTSVSVARDPKKCIACGRCITVCNDVQTVNAINFVDRGIERSAAIA